MRNYIIFNDFNTVKVGLIEELPIVNKAEKNQEFIEIDGRHGFLTLDKKNYKPIDYSFQIIIKGKEKQNLIKSKFKGTGKLILSNDLDKFYKAVVTSNISFERQIRDVVICTISFRLQPFAYEINNEPIVHESSFVLYNITNTTSQPIIKVYGLGTGTLKINDNEIYIKNIDNCIVLNFELEEAYDLKGNLKNSKVKGDFEELIEGINSISWVGGITKIEITPNWRWL